MSEDPRSRSGLGWTLLAGGALAAGITGAALHVASGLETPPTPVVERSAEPATPAPAVTPERPSVTSEPAPAREVDGNTVLALVRDLFDAVEPVDHSADPDFGERRRLQLGLETAKKVLTEVERTGLRGDALYDDARYRLLAEGETDAVLLIDAFQRYQEELAAIDARALPRAGYLEAVHEARRNAFGPEQAGQLFLQKEALERLEIAEAEVAADPELTDDQKAEKVAALRTGVKADLAKRGTLVSFRDEGREEVEAELRDRHGDALDAMTPEQVAEARRQIHFERLPEHLQEKVVRLRERQASQRAHVLAYRAERDAILADDEMDQETRQQLLAELRAEYGVGGS